MKCFVSVKSDGVFEPYKYNNSNIYYTRELRQHFLSRFKLQLQTQCNADFNSFYYLPRMVYIRSFYLYDTNCRSYVMYHICIIWTGWFERLRRRSENGDFFIHLLDFKGSLTNKFINRKRKYYNRAF